MDREELLAIYEDRDNLPYIASGCYNMVKRLSPGFVVKISKNDGTDATTWDYMEWCHLRLLRYGARSPEMVGFPIVIGVLNEPGMRMAVMGRCIPAWNDHRSDTGRRLIDKHASYALKVLLDTFEVDSWSLDLHSGNAMWCAVRGCLVLTDPFCSDHATGPASSLPQPIVKMPKLKAQWLRPGLQQLHRGVR